ncbi:hypothetical protein [Stappia sp. ICDLI1TA098]|jgi:hypothetical protein
MAILLKISSRELIFAGGAFTDKDSHLRLNAGANRGVIAVSGAMTPHVAGNLGSHHHLYLDYGINGLGWADVRTTHVDLAGLVVGV